MDFAHLHFESFGASFWSLTTAEDDVISFSSFCLRLWKSSGRRCAGRGGTVTLRSGDETTAIGDLRVQDTSSGAGIAVKRYLYV